MIFTKRVHPNFKSPMTDAVMPEITLRGVDFIALYHYLWCRIGPDQICTLGEKKVRHRRDIMKTEVIVEFSIRSVIERDMSPKSIIEAIMRMYEAGEIGGDIVDMYYR
jgi:hypothetical protein